MFIGKKIYYNINNRETNDMPGGNKNIKPEDNIAGFQVNPQNIHREGRPKGFKGLTETLKNIINSDGSMTIENIYEIDDKGKETGNIFKRAKVKIPKKEMIILAGLKKGLSGDMRAIEWLFDRIDGKAVQPLEHSGSIKFLDILQAASEKMKDARDNRDKSESG